MIGDQFSVFRGKPYLYYSSFVKMVKNFGLVTLLSLSWGYQHHVSAALSVPVIGILSQPVSDNSYQYIAASYVKWLESAGATAIVIPYDADESLTREIFSQINGVLFPGGGVGKDVPTYVQIEFIYSFDVECKDIHNDGSIIYSMQLFHKVRE